MSKTIPAILVLADGTVFRGTSIGVAGQTVAEVVFNTSMTGYQEILTDPSYTKQIVTLTYPHIGNYGVNAEDVESGQVYASGLIVRHLPLVHSNFRSSSSLSQYLVDHKIVAIAEIDTRKLTRILREKGAQTGAIVAGVDNEDEAIEEAKKIIVGFPGLSGLDLAKVVSVQSNYAFTESEWALGTGYQVAPESQFHVVAYDYGVKKNILRMLVARGCKVTVVPAQTSAQEVFAMQPDGVFLSNGPGDPAPCDYAIAAIKEIVDSGMPTFGICLGHQLLALASGAKTLKMKFGHHGANHPVQDVESKRVYITSQNHGFAVDTDTLPDTVKVTHVSLFDGSLQGIARTDQPAFSFQGHPEASPGPTEMAYLFDRFIGLIEAKKQH